MSNVSRPLQLKRGDTVAVLLPSWGGPSVFPEAADEYERVLYEPGPHELTAFSAWTDRYAPWGDSANVGKVSEIHEDDIGHRWINTGSRSSGRLWGGCIEVLVMMNGTFAWPGQDFWQDRVLMLETSEDAPTPDYVAFTLRNFGMQGILERITGLLVARPKGYSPARKQELDSAILRIVCGEFGRDDLNIVTNLDFGHTDPRHIMPIGLQLELDPDRKTLRFTEPLFTCRSSSI